MDALLERSFVKSPERLGEQVSSPESNLRQKAQEAWQLFEQGDYAEAFSSYKALLDDFPNSPELLGLLGIASLRLGRYADAIKLARQALKSMPEDPAMLTLLGASMASRGQIQEALELFETARQIDPENIDAAFNLGLALSKLGRHKDAISVLDSVLMRLSVVQSEELLELRQTIVFDSLRRLVNAGFASWSGGKPDLPKRPAKLKPGKTASDYIIEERDRLR